MIREYTFAPLMCTEDRVEIVCTEDNMRALKFPLRAVGKYLITDPEEIKARQMIFADILQGRDVQDFLMLSYEKTELLADFLKKAGNLADGENEAMLYSLRELILFTETVDTLAEKSAFLDVEKLQSKRLSSLVLTLRLLSQDEQYLAVKAWLAGYSDNLKNIQSLTIGINLDAQLNAKEIGIVSFNTEPFATSTALNKWIKDYKPSKEFTVLTPLGIKNTGLTDHAVRRIDSEFYLGMNRIIKSSVKGIKKYLTESLQKTIISFASLRDELAFFVQGTNYIGRLKKAGLPTTFPRIGERNEITCLYNPLLLDHLPAGVIIPSNLHMDNEHRVFILTGPNSGGKTVFVQAVGIAQLFFQLGMPVSANRAVMAPYDRVITHFVEGSVKSTESRLANETVRLKESIDKIEGRSLLLLDETFSGTNVYDALILSEALVKYLAKQSTCNAIYITHIHELNERIETLQSQKPYDGIHLMAAGIRDSHRTYEIVPYTGVAITSGFARDVVIESGLGFLFDEG